MSVRTSRPKQRYYEMNEMVLHFQRPRHFVRCGHFRAGGTSVITSRPTLSRSLEVTGTDRDRSTTYDFLSVIYSNHGPMSYTLSLINGDFSRKLANFFHPRVFNAPLRGSPWDFVKAIALGKNRDHAPNVQTVERL